jgi:coenzyme F420-reducing hydrogenase delta subunit
LNRNQMTRLEIYKECVSEFGIDPALMDEYVVSESYNPLTDGDPDEEVAEDVIAEIRAEWMPIIADWVRESEEKKRNYVLPHAPNKTNERRTGTAMTRREVIKQAAAEFGIEDEFVDTLLASENPELLEVQLAFDEELSEDEAKCVRNFWMNHYSSMREAIAASTDKARTGDNCADTASRERNRWMRLTKTTIIPVAGAALVGFAAGYNSRAPNHPAGIAVARSPEIRPL